MMANPINKLTTVDEQDGQTLSVVGDTYRLVLTGDQTGGAYAAIDMLIPPQGGPGPHAHPDFQESFYVMEGEIVVKSETGTYTARKGSFVTIPLGGIVHAFKNETNTIAHLLCVVVPAGLDKFFQEIVAASIVIGMPPEARRDSGELLTHNREKADLHGPASFMDLERHTYLFR